MHPFELLNSGIIFFLVWVWEIMRILYPNLLDRERKCIHARYHVLPVPFSISLLTLLIVF